MTIKPDPEIASPTEILSLINKLEDLQQTLRQGRIKERLHLKAATTVDEAVITGLKQLHIKPQIDSIEEVGAIVTSLKDWLASAPVVHLTFSTPPAPPIKRQIITWFHEEIGPEVLAEFLVDGSIATGFVLRTRNHIFNFTGNQVLWDNRRRITELVQGV